MRLESCLRELIDKIRIRISKNQCIFLSDCLPTNLIIERVLKLKKNNVFYVGETQYPTESLRLHCMLLHVDVEPDDFQ